MHMVYQRACKDTENQKKFIKLKKPKHLQEVLDIARFLIAEIEKGGSSNEVIEEKKNKLEQVF